MRTREGCIFCAIVAGKAPAFRVAEDESALAFMDFFPVSDGHTLVIPKDHAQDVFEMQEEIDRTMRVFDLRPTSHPPGASTSPAPFRNEFPPTSGGRPAMRETGTARGPALRSSMVWCAQPGNELDPTSRAHL